MEKKDFISVGIIVSVIVICFALIFWTSSENLDSKDSKGAKNNTETTKSEADATVGENGETGDLSADNSNSDESTVAGQDNINAEDGTTGNSGKNHQESTTGKSAENSTSKNSGSSTGNNSGNNTGNNSGNNSGSGTGNGSTTNTTGNSTGNSTEEATTGNTTENTNLLSRLNNVTVTPENLGVSTALTNKYGSNGLAMNIWDMKSYNGKVFICSGDYDSNTGSSPIFYITNDSTELKTTTCTLASGAVWSALNTEAVERLFLYEGGLYALATDPAGQPSYSGYYKYDESKNTWQEYAAFANGIHYYDMVEYDGKIFFGGMALEAGSTDNIDGCVFVLNKSDLGTSAKGELLKFYQQDGVTPYSTSRGTYYHYWRVYDMFVYKNELYAIHNTGGPTWASGLFKYDKEKNAFVVVYDGREIRGVIAVANRRTTYTYVPGSTTGKWVKTDGYYDFDTNEVIVGRLKIGIECIECQHDEHGNLDEKFIVGDTIVLVKNGIYKSNGVSDFKKVSLGSGCDNYVVRDAFEMDGKYYFLASEMLGTDNYTTTIFETDANFTTYRKIISMNTQSFARSFVYNDGYLYIALGSNQQDSDTGYSQYSGTILRVNLENIG